MNNQNQKGISSLLAIIIVIVIGVLAIGGVLAYQYLVKPEPEEPTIIENRLTYEWGTLKFSYPNGWRVQKDYYRTPAQEAAGEPAQEIGLTIFPGEEIQGNNYIGVGGRQMSCYNLGMTKCVNAGYGLDIYPTYTFSNNQEVLKTFDLIVKSVKDFGGTISFDIPAIKETVSGFLRAKQRRNLDEAKPYLTPEFAKTVDPIGFAGTSNPHTGRFEFKDAVSFSSAAKAYEVKVRVYQEYTGEGDIGYSDDIFYIKQAGEKYFIDNIEYGQYIPLQ